MLPSTRFLAGFAHVWAGGQERVPRVLPGGSSPPGAWEIIEPIGLPAWLVGP
jgi:hypothetical protein